MDQLFNSNTTSEKNEEKRDKNGKNEEEPLEEDEFDLAYKMIFTDTLRTRGDQVRWKVKVKVEYCIQVRSVCQEHRSNLTWEDKDRERQP